MAHPIPDGHHTVTPHLVIKGATEAIEFYKRAFGAEELYRMPFPGPDGRVKLGHAELQIGSSRLFLADEFPEHGSKGPNGSSPVTIHLYVTDAGRPFLFKYRQPADGWRGTLPPAAVARVLSEEVFLRGRLNPQEGGAKGLDLTRDGSLLAVTCEEQPLAVFDVAALFD